MKRRMIWILLAGILVGLALSGLYKHFVTDRIMDGGNGMENPDQNLFLLDGDGTYVDNSLLWPVLEGTWESPEDGWQAVISEEDGLTLRLDGETVLETPLDFTYIPRKKIQDKDGDGGRYDGSVYRRRGIQSPDKQPLVQAYSAKGAKA